MVYRKVIEGYFIQKYTNASEEEATLENGSEIIKVTEYSKNTSDSIERTSLRRKKE